MYVYLFVRGLSYFQFNILTKDKMASKLLSEFPIISILSKKWNCFIDVYLNINTERMEF